MPSTEKKFGDTAVATACSFLPPISIETLVIEYGKAATSENARARSRYAEYSKNDAERYGSSVVRTWISRSVAGSVTPGGRNSSALTADRPMTTAVIAMPSETRAVSARRQCRPNNRRECQRADWSQ